MIEADRAGGALDSRDEIESPRDLVSYWLLELDLADKAERGWREDAAKAVRDYNRRDQEASNFNILYANTSVLKAALFKGATKPDVRRRFFDSEDRLAKDFARGLERVLSFLTDEQDWDYHLHKMADDYLLAGRGVIRVQYVQAHERQHESDGDPVYETVKWEAVEWDDFRLCPARSWDKVRWVAFRSYLTRDELVARFGEVGEEVRREHLPFDDRDHKAAEAVRDAFRRAEVWQVWDKATRQVVTLSPGYKEGPLKVEPDPLRLVDFFPIPRPLYSVESPDSMVPTPEYRMYERQAQELHEISRRIRRLTEAIRARGIYDATIPEIEEVLENDDAVFSPASGVTSAMQTGGLDRAFWFMPIETMARVLQVLFQARQQALNLIYEITGIADIVRGRTVASETATAQSLKTQFATLRLDYRRREVQRLVRDMYRMTAEIVIENFSAETISLMANEPVTEDQVAEFSIDVLRNVRIDIETEAGLAGDMESEKRQVVELLQGIVGFIQGMGPAVQAQFIPPEVAKTLLISAVRRFAMGREVEDALEEFSNEAEAEAEGGAQNAAAQQAAALQAAAQEAAQRKAAEEQAQAQARQLELQAKAQTVQLQIERDRQEHAFRMERLQVEQGLKLAELELKKAELDRARTDADTALLWPDGAGAQAEEELL